MLRQHGVDLKTAQELLRHANSRITLEIHQRAVSEEKRVAQNLVLRGLLEGGSTQHPSGTSGDCMKELISAITPYVSGVYGGDDGARTRDLCRDSLAL
jgi:hypothetical protein